MRVETRQNMIPTVHAPKPGPSFAVALHTPVPAPCATPVDARRYGHQHGRTPNSDIVVGCAMCSCVRVRACVCGRAFALVLCVCVSVWACVCVLVLCCGAMRAEAFCAHCHVVWSGVWWCMISVVFVMRRCCDQRTRVGVGCVASVLVTLIRS